MTLAERLGRMIEEMPDDASVLLPVGRVRQWLGDHTPQTEPSPQTPIDYTVEQVAQKMGKTPSTIRGWLTANEIPEAYKLFGREWRIPDDALRAFQQRQRERQPTQSIAGQQLERMSDWKK